MHNRNILKRGAQNQAPRKQKRGLLDLFSVFGVPNGTILEPIS